MTWLLKLCFLLSNSKSGRDKKKDESNIIKAITHNLCSSIFVRIYQYFLAFSQTMNKDVYAMLVKSVPTPVNHFVIDMM